MRTPASTYRLQLGRACRLADARALVAYLDRLGASDLYLSPVFAARSGSPHGYDVVDPTRVNPELGSEDELVALGRDLRARSMGLLLDLVPNHMALSSENAWLADVLERGRASRFASFFDIDWDPRRPGSRGKLLLPILGAPLAEILDRGELAVVADERGARLRYWRTELPLAKGSLPPRRARSLSRSEMIALLDAQPWRLGFWRTASARLNYRRFFDISDLISVRVEDPAVFDATHALALRLARDGVATGLRIDHVDGLLDPLGYLRRLRAAAGDAWIVVEKILTGDEALPDDWPVEGTTGYDFLKVLNGVFADLRGVRDLDRLYARYAGITARFEDLVVELKKRVLRELFPGELAALGRELERLAFDDLRARDVPTDDLVRALVHVTACAPVYRTYVRDAAVAARDVAVVDASVSEARARAPDLDPVALDFVRRVLLQQAPGALAFTRRWQQLTGPVMAKGLEDTALYVWARLLSLNDVGARRSRTRSLEDLHRLNALRLARWPLTLSATTTHDTKRSEDVRARLNVLSELPGEWAQCIARWTRLARERGGLDRNEVLHLWQTIVGAWPLDESPSSFASFVERVRAYAVKAAREAKVHTSWLRPDEAHERALEDFVSDVLAPGPLREDVARFARKIALHGAWTSLAQVVVKTASPGVPDFYQGTELFWLALVDPDNRRPVDFARRRRMLDELDRRERRDRAALLDEVVREWRDGRVKMLVTSRALRFRRERAELFARGDYRPLWAPRPWRDRVIAFDRRLDGEWAIALAPRLVATITPPDEAPLGERVWGGATLPLPPGAPTRWTCALSGRELVARGGAIRLAEAFAKLPVALLYTPTAKT